MGSLWPKLKGITMLKGIAMDGVICWPQLKDITIDGAIS